MILAHNYLWGRRIVHTFLIDFDAIAWADMSTGKKHILILLPTNRLPMMKQWFVLNTYSLFVYYINTITAVVRFLFFNTQGDRISNQFQL